MRIGTYSNGSWQSYEWIKIYSITWTPMSTSGGITYGYYSMSLQRGQLGTTPIEHVPEELVEIWDGIPPYGDW